MMQIQTNVHLLHRAALRAAAEEVLQQEEELEPGSQQQMSAPIEVTSCKSQVRPLLWAMSVGASERLMVGLGGP